MLNVPLILLGALVLVPCGCLTADVRYFKANINSDPNQVDPPPPAPASSSSMTLDLSGLLTTGGVFPHLAVTAASGPKRSECGIGALIPWADHLYMVRGW